MSRRRPRADDALLLLVFALALALRFLPVHAATAGGIRLLSPDCYGHLRRSTSVARNFPRVPVVDPYLNHPDGGVWIWPPAFDLLVGGAARVVFGSRATREQVAVVAATIPPILGALHVFPLYAFARLALSRRRALFAVVAYAVLPAAILWSCFGHADHHVAETLVLLTFLTAASRAALAPPGRARAVAAVLAGVCLGVALLTWQGAVFVAGLALPWALVFLGPSAALLGAAGALVAALGTFLALGGAHVPFAFISFGWFQPALVAAGTIPLALAAAFRACDVRRRVAALALAAGLLFATLPVAPRLAGALFRGSVHLVTKNAVTGADDFADGGYLSYPAELISLIAECKPLLSPASASTILANVRELSAGFLLLPFALALWTRSVFVHDSRRGPRTLLVLFGAALLFMTLFQRRNVYYLCVFTALALAEAVARVRAGRRPGPLPRLALSAATLALVAGLGLMPLRRIHAYASAPGSDFLDLIGRLRDLDPPGVDPASLPPPAPGAIAGVLPPWSAGHFVTALAERPAAADPFAYGWRRQCRLFTTPEDAEARRILTAARCRYLITTDLRAVLPAYAAAVGRAGAPLDSMLAMRVHFSKERSPLPFLLEVDRSRGGFPLRDGTLVPFFRVFRVSVGP